MRHSLRWSMVSVAIASLVLQGVAGTVLGTSGNTCFSPTSVGSSVSVYGNWIENIDRVTTSAAGVTVRIVSKLNGAQNNTGSFAGKGVAVISIATNNASPGAKTINLINDPDLGLGGETFTFTITVFALPTVTNVSAQSPADPFKEITVTFTGTGLQNAKDPAAGSVVIDNLIPFITVGGNATLSSVRVLSSSNTSLQAKLFFTALIQDATVDLTFRSTEPCSPIGIVTGGVKQRVRLKSTNIKNYVESITFPSGSTFDVNSVGVIHLNLLFPAPGALNAVQGAVTGLKKASPLTRFADLLTANSATRTANSTVFFQFLPRDAFDSVAGGTLINRNGLTEVTARAGDNVIPITFRVKNCVGGQPGTVNAVRIQTWMQNKNSTLPPDFVEQQFGVRCVQ